MPLIYKIDVIESLKEKGMTTYSLRRNKLLSESTIQKLREQKSISWENLETLCRLLNCQIGEIIEYVNDEQ